MDTREGPLPLKAIARAVAVVNQRYEQCEQV